MKVLVLGCGSIGSRRAKILAKRKNEIWCVDKDLHTATALAMEVGGHALSVDLMWPKVDAVLICTPPNSGRLEQIERAVDVDECDARGLFVEKPLAMTSAEIGRIEDVVMPPTTMGCCNLRFCGGVSGLRKIPKPWRLATFRMRQAAKYWNPAHEPISLVLDSIHELDLAVDLQGPIETIRGYSTLEAAEASIHHQYGGISHVFMDRITDPPLRDVSILRDRDRDYLRLRVDDDVYCREMDHFLAATAKGEPSCNPLEGVIELNLKALGIA